MTQEEFYEAVTAHMAAVEGSLTSIEETATLLYAALFALLVVAVGACFYYLFWRRRR